MLRASLKLKQFADGFRLNNKEFRGLFTTIGLDVLPREGDLIEVKEKNNYNFRVVEIIHSAREIEEGDSEADHQIVLIVECADLDGLRRMGY